jgi:hypothetical protein
VIGYPIFYANLPHLPWDLGKYRLCDNIFGAIAREDLSMFPSMTLSLVRSYSNPFYITRLLGNSTKGDSLTSFDNPTRFI